MGKSTLIKTLSGLLPPISGSISYKGVDVLTMNEVERAKLISYVSTKPIEVSNISVEDYISFGRYPYTNWLGMKRREDNLMISKAIELCGVDYLIHRNYQTLSDGEKQRINIARAIAQDTPIIILDEPTAHLDLINKIGVLKLLKTLSADYGKTILFSSHQIEYALQLCDLVWTIGSNGIESIEPDKIANSHAFKELINQKEISFDKENMVFKLL
jgi:iron complex transport system ATP-binding protein